MSSRISGLRRERERGRKEDRLVQDLQIESIRAMIALIRTLHGIEGQRIVLWGASLGTGHLLPAAADDPAVKVVIGQQVFAEGEHVVTRSITEE
ncbi:hypothetical protein G3O00_41910 [Burkholderia sp. Ac-20384]|uniref:hypothetical protein n=1 Tax=Burkholderia sp. Ac-20384 TaxID=2703902 RepID=UPI00197D0342|nr:hypothetical protein [Burkholderia sp. Ac-20384]MBN3830067.1 hypothetical protein [Burkholderia sp. Ac-20384]